MKDLTTKQRAVLRFIMLRKNSSGNLPTMREIADRFGWSSSNSAQVHVKALRRKGYLAPAKAVKARIELPQGRKP